MTTDTSGSNPMRDAALSYARAGWPVVRLDDALAPTGDEPTLDHETIIRWWAANAQANVGVALGMHNGSKRGLCALIVESRGPSQQWLEAMKASDRIGPGHFYEAGSPGRTAWLFAITRPVVGRELADGASLLADGILAMPPSWSGGHERHWRKGRHDPERAVPPLPQWIAELPAWESRIEETPAVAISDDWQRELILTEKGAIKSSLANISLILRCADRFAGRLAYNEMRLTPTLDGVVMADEHVAMIRERIEREFQCNPNDSNTRAAILSVACERKFHPVRDYLTSLQWDHLPRIENVATQILRIPSPTSLERRQLRAWFVSAIARAVNHGCKVDTSLVLVGPQSYRKSMFFDKLGGPWFSDSFMDIRNKDSLMQIAAAWIYEWGEIENVTGRREASEVKQFLAARIDNFRPPFERSVRQVPRSAVVVGTTNRERFLVDETGSRRFWVLRVPEPVDADLLVAWRDQLWAEALVAYRARETWWLTRDEDAERETANDTFREEDAWAPIVREWIRANLRRDYLTHEILEGALRVHRDAIDARATYRLAAILRELGFRSDKPRIARDGRQLGPTRAWVWRSEFSVDKPPQWVSDGESHAPPRNESADDGLA